MHHQKRRTVRPDTLYYSDAAPNVQAELEDQLICPQQERIFCCKPNPNTPYMECLGKRLHLKTKDLLKMVDVPTCWDLKMHLPLLAAAFWEGQNLGL